MAEAAVAAPATTTPAAPAPAKEAEARPVDAVQSDKPGAVAADVSAKPAPTDDERRAARIAAARRESARVAAEREAVERDRAKHSEDLRWAAEARRLHALKDTDPLRYLDEVGLKIGDLSRRYLEKGQGKTPEQIAEEVYARKEAERRKVETEASSKESEAKAIRDREAAYAGAKTTLGKLIDTGGARYETLAKLSKGGLGDVAVDKAFKLIEDYHRETKQILDFGKALDAVEAKFKVLAQTEQPVAASAKAEAKPASGSKSAPVKVADVKEVETPSSKPLNRRLTPRDQKRIAMELVAAAKASQDT